MDVRESNPSGCSSEGVIGLCDLVLKSGQVLPERLFILEPKSLAPEKKDKVRDSRVDFKMK
jgi:hypothetical protein